MAAPRGFPLLVQGSWGPDPPKNLSTKLQMYFQSPKRSGGGECEVYQEPGSPLRFRVLFFPFDVRQRVLERENHELGWAGQQPFKLTVCLPEASGKAHGVFKQNTPTKVSNAKDATKEPGVSKELDAKLSPDERSEKVPKECENISSSVAFENLQANVSEVMLTLLVENVSGLSSNDFQLEIIRDFDVAVVTFLKRIDTREFVDNCCRYLSVKQLQLSPRLLEVTTTIRVENLPPGADEHNLGLFFESPSNGGGRVASVECFPEESSALIKFFDRKVLDTIMTKQLAFNKMPLSVFPYYPSLGTALYGKEKPLIKLPASFREALDLPLWKFFQKNRHLMEEINDKMRHCHCELTWSQLDGKVVIRPAATLVQQGRWRIKNWQRDASIELSAIRMKYKVTAFNVEPRVWDAISNDLEEGKILIEFDPVTQTVTLAGKSEDVQNIEPQIKGLIETTIQKIKREEQSVEETLAVSPGDYLLLCHSGELERVHSGCSELSMHYSLVNQHLSFTGLREDVYKAKCEIQEKVHSMVHRNIQVPSEILWFLQQVDYKEFSESLFVAHNILTIYKLEGTTVLLTSYSSEVQSEAEKRMLSALTYKCLDVENQEVLKDKQWQGLTTKLHKKHNSSSKTVIIKEFMMETPARVIITGCVKEVNDVYSLLLGFLEKHMKIERLVEIKHSLVIDYMKAEKKQFWSKFKKANTQVIFKPQDKKNGILLVGPKAEVLEGVTACQQFRDAICVESIRIDKPGARQFFQDKSRYYKSEIRRLFSCFIELQKDEAKDGGSKCYSRTDLASGITLIVQQGDLSHFPVDVVVNATNEDLQHFGGLAAALSKAAGPELQADCDQIVKKLGKLSPGNATISKAGKLPYHHVIHAVGPRWEAGEDSWCVHLLKRAVKASLLLAERHKYQSIALPAISSGVFGFPIKQCTETIVSAIKEDFQSKRAGGTLKEIYLVDVSEKTVEAFAAAVRALLTDPHPGPASLPSLPPVVQPEKTSQKQPSLVGPGGLKLLMVRGDAQSAMTDVVVNSIPSDLSLDKGPLSRALLEKAGPQLQQELDTTGQGLAVSVGTVVQTKGYNLHCSHVLHVVAPNWSNGDTSSCQVMEDIIRNCLTITEGLSLKTIAFPAIGTGTLGFPKTVFAELIISEVLKFSANNQLKTLQEVHFLLHPKDHENIQAFSDEFSRRANGNPISDSFPKSEDKQGVYGTVSSPDLGVYEMKIGPIIFQVASGDITKEAADVIVNSTSNTFNLKAGVSKAILNCAGKNVEMECSLQAQQTQSNYIVTQGGLLRCKNIIHVIGGKNVKKSVFCVLQECEKRNYSSICLPAIGTGNAQKDPNKVAEDIISAVEDFVQKGLVQSVQKVKVVILLPQILNVFYDNMRKREGSQASAQPTMMSKLAELFGFSKQPSKPKKPLVLERKIDSANFQVCGENLQNVKSAISWIQDLIEKEQCPYTSEDECIRDFDEKEYEELNELQKKLNITISLDRKKPVIKVLGISRDVMQARDEIEEMFKRVRATKEQSDRADYLSGFIEWQYSHQNTFCCFDKITNLQLEDAKKEQKRQVVVKINNRDYTVDLETLTAVSANGHAVTIQRLRKAEVELPANWSPMNSQSLLVVELRRDQPEYSSVASSFHQTCPNFTIEKIERIQNPYLWNSYQVKKKAMDSKNGQTNNEKLLFHGTDADSLPHVNGNGFNRSYAGKNAVAYGKGTYFAVDASYSANNTYSKPDRNGRKHMYYVRVLTGIYTCGQSSYIVPPPKNPQNVTDLYDSVTDNVNNPSLFVVFYDYQAYPEYLITFR